MSHPQNWMIRFCGWQELEECDAGLVREPGAAQGMEVLDNQVSTKDEMDMCRDWRSKQGCSRGISCRWLHPTGKGWEERLHL